ncbi:MAG TPA: phosphoribosylanthranilate isomerase [Kofleriaceae bacterium]|nr:phosphoribosylanthranilate isomerase [Kofleriaceae bacterium]
MTQLKICGVTRASDATQIARTGVEYLGINFWPRSKRHVTPERAVEVAAAARRAGGAQIVGVFVDATAGDIADVLARVTLDIIQLHGRESPDEVRAIADAIGLPVWKALAIGSLADVDAIAHYTADAILLDTPTPGRGGSGRTFDWSLAQEARRRDPSRRIVLAGGLAADNVGLAIASVEPWAVDVASGVESAPGIKDPAKLAAFVSAARG